MNNQFSDFIKIAKDKYDFTKFNNSSETIYDVLTKEKDFKETIDRIIEYQKEKEIDKQFINTKFIDIIMNVFKELNNSLDDLLKIKKITPNKMKRFLRKKHRVIYLGLFLIMCAVFLSLIEVSDSV